MKRTMVTLAGLALVTLTGCHGASIPTAQRVQSCEQAHQLAQAHQVSTASGHEPTAEGGTTPEGETLVESCTWPPARGADPDGYLRITVDTVEGPGQAEATGDTLLDNIHGSCARYRLTYAFGFQGEHHTVMERVRAGTSEKLGEGAYPVGSEPVPYPDPTGVVVTHNGNNVLTDASCDK